MLAIAAEKLAAELRSHIALADDAAGAADAPEYVVLAGPDPRDGSRSGSAPRDRVVVSLVRLAPDAALRSAPVAAPGAGGHRPPPRALEADFLISADYADYALALQRIDQSLGWLSDGLAFELERAEAGAVRVTAAPAPLALEALGRLWLSFRASPRPAFLLKARLVAD